MTAGIIARRFLAQMLRDGALFQDLHRYGIIWRSSCLSLVRFLDFLIKRTNTKHFIQKRELWTH
jgi:hypothetical protein